MRDPSTAASVPLAEHRVPRGRGTVYVRDFAGTGLAFVLLHGFPDNYDPGGRARHWAATPASTPESLRSARASPCTPGHRS